MEKEELKKISEMLKVLPINIGKITVEDLNEIYSQKEKEK